MSATRFRREVTRVVGVLTGKLEAVKTRRKWLGQAAALHVTVRFIAKSSARVERCRNC